VIYSLEMNRSVAILLLVACIFAACADISEAVSIYIYIYIYIYMQGNPKVRRHTGYPLITDDKLFIIFFILFIDVGN